MRKKQRLFIIITFLFFAAMLYVGYDISSRTTFPGSKPQLRERLLNGDEAPADSVSTDSIGVEM
ncbi:hypothetical protein C900_01439 [Fulvivirga imtechensis AK7]|uniref:Uncharacterized protein n=1 Tax=Fulvivirga imtechensis AK7 TaxID=1237149 RepID=L8K1M7_9BACT|nr:hypothetical protein [Fulvivirga imtechensis]ELR73829.1 hypothetical protein C900_01439 [Fulvivirga imtechensis AK7]